MDYDRRVEVVERYFPGNKHQDYIVYELLNITPRHHEMVSRMTDREEWIRYITEEQNYDPKWAAAIWDLIKGH